MSRRDTIIIAVLINAGLLVVLFSTALKSNKSDEIAQAPVEKQLEQQMAPVVTEIPVQQHEIASIAPQKDEVDQVLRQFAQPTVAEAQEAPKSDFAQDLNALTAAPQVTTAANVIEVTVKKGDVLEKIARVNHTSVEDIMRLNNLSSSRLKIGQVLKVSPNKKTGSKASTSNEVKYYTVKSGDNPWTIAVKNHMKVEELLKLNNLDKEKAKHLKAGDQLRIK